MKRFLFAALAAITFALAACGPEETANEATVSSSQPADVQSCNPWDPPPTCAGSYYCNGTGAYKGQVFAFDATCNLNAAEDCKAFASKYGPCQVLYCTPNGCMPITQSCPFGREVEPPGMRCIHK